MRGRSESHGIDLSGIADDPKGRLLALGLEVLGDVAGGHESQGMSLLLDFDRS